MPRIKKVEWPDYRDKLLPILEETDKKNRHRAADETDQALLNRRAFLFLTPDCFFVLKPLVIDGEMFNLVLFAYSFTSHSVIRYQPTIEQLTRDISGKGIIVFTVVKPLARMLLRMGYQEVSRDGRNIKLIKEI